MIRFCILGSSSAGNCTVIDTGNVRVLIDAGFSGKRIMSMLAERGLSIDDIQAVLITHEHTDHVAGLRGLSSKPHLQFFSNRKTAAMIDQAFDRRFSWKYFESGSVFRLGDLEIHTFSIPHDAHDPVSYILKKVDAAGMPLGPSLAWMADLGHIPNSIKAPLATVDCLIIESNYDNEMLEADEKRSFSLKQRIRGRHGHLSNTDALEFLCSVPNPSWKHVHCVHLSRDCNRVELVQSAKAILERHGRNFDFHVCDPNGSLGPWHEVRGIQVPVRSIIPPIGQLELAFLN
jgi:phosphoribosyl 1,2-cyclic phosphodiesterase